MTSVFKNAIRRRLHRERAQPADRKKFGLLEKKKDYKERANDYHRKERHIRSLQNKARFRNPDEFYFKMHQQTTQDGVHVLERGKQYSAKARAQMKDQDINYLTLKSQLEKEKIAKMQAELHCLDESNSSKNKHVIFCDNVKEVKEFTAEKYFDTAPELADRAFNRPRIETLKQAPVQSNVDRRARRRAERARAKQYKELIARKKRKSKVDEMLGKLTQQKQLTSKGKRKKIVELDRFGDEIKSKTRYKWALERK